MVYVITGGPGFGKTSILNRLDELGFPVCPEIARKLISEMAGPSISGQSHFPVNFEQLVAKERLNFLIANSIDSIAFSDRGLPDQIAFSLYKKKQPSAFMEELVANNRYAPFVFVTPPWEEIYSRDEVRGESFTEAVQIHEQIVAVYSGLSYKIINLPLTNTEKRVRFILDFLGI